MGEVASEAGGTGLSQSLDVSLVLFSYLCGHRGLHIHALRERSTGQGWWGVLQHISWFLAPYRVPLCKYTQLTPWQALRGL